MSYYPKKYLQNQLQFWSKKLNPQEAFENTIKCTQIIMFENISKYLNLFYEKTGIKLLEQKINVGQVKEHGLNNKEINIIREKLESEYIYYNKVRDFYGLEKC